MQNHLHQSHGFTFLEIIIAVAIIGVLAVVVVANTLQAKARTRDTTRIDDITNIAKAMQMYSTENFSYPRIDDHLGNCIGIGIGNNVPEVGIDELLLPYLGTVPKDPKQSITLARGQCGQRGADKNEFYYYYDRTHRCSSRQAANNLKGRLSEIHIQRLEMLTYSSNLPQNLCPDNPLGSTGTNGQFLDADYAIILDEPVN